MTGTRTYGMRQMFSGMSPAVKLVFVCLIILVCLLLSTFLATLAAIPIFGHTLFDILDVLGRPGSDDLALLKYFQIVQSIFVFVLPAMMAAWLFSSNTFGYMKAKSVPRGIWLIVVPCTIVLGIPFLNAVTFLNGQLDLPPWLDNLEEKIVALEENAAHLTVLFLQSNGTRDLLINLLMIAVLPAIGEEFLFRGVIQRLLTEWTKNLHLGIWLGAFIFSFFHFQFFGFLPRFLLGLYFGYLFAWSGTIWIPVAGHFINNGLAVVYYHFSKKEMGETLLDNIGTPGHAGLVLIVTTAITALLLYVTYKLRQSNRPVSTDRVGVN